MRPRRARNGWRGWNPGALAATCTGLTGEVGSRHQVLGAHDPSHPVWTESSGGRSQGEGPVINTISRTCLAQSSRGKQVADEEDRGQECSKSGAQRNPVQAEPLPSGYCGTE